MLQPETEWRQRVPELVARYAARWELDLGEPFGGGSAAHVVAATTADGQDAVLKLSLPHREARGEAAALRWWAGDGAVRLLREEPADYALLIERCRPGVPLTAAEQPPRTRLTVAAELLARVWRHGIPPPDSGMERLTDVAAEWADLVEERLRQLAPPYDRSLVARGAELLRTLPHTGDREVVVHGDFNPGNVLSAADGSWKIIDPKPMIGDPGYDFSPLLLQVDDPFTHADPAPVLRERVALVAEIVQVPPDRLLAWCLARLVEGALWYADRGEIGPGGDAMDAAAVINELLAGRPR
ncbi:aminoglycoside phosphotransferase family protein [Microlunatus parietis]|uniref:Streptomycin 6-kinase n=1 Tax=Microlunatus parietis TaxID=682979 RepID=A0A7Y9LCF9_9ACTN|nr:aminoglycoside phosphotransferase family protein [Microlunatus parietis]NYE74789.1 streptomycin 6-kinase [Microlunatus parietis]